MLAFSYSMPGNDGEVKAVEVDQKAVEEEQKAQKELDKLNTDDSTSAFVGLLQAQELQQKIEKQAIANTGGDEESVQIEEEFKKASGQKNATKKAAPKPVAKKLAQTSSVKKAPKTVPAQDEAPDKETLLTFSTSVAQQAEEIDDSQNLQLSDEKPLIAAQTSSMSKQMMDQMSRLKFTPEQIEYISTLNNVQTKQLSQEDPQVVAQAEGEQETEGPKKKKPIDKVEKDQQPADNDDDEKLADNHRKMSKIELKKEEIRKLEDTHQALTKDAVIQAKSGASMKKVQHNLKIAKSVAQRVQDLKQQVDSDQKQLQQVQNIDEIEPLLPFKKDTPKIHHDDVKNIPSV